MKRNLPRFHRLPDWFKRRIKHQKRKIQEQRERERVIKKEISKSEKFKL